LREHLEWLDREIAKESGIVVPSAPTAGISLADVKAPVIASPVVNELTLASLAGYTPPDPKTTAADTKKGCLVAAMVAFVVFTASLIGIYFWKYSDRPLLFAEPAKPPQTH
jgi:hypothetical protein